MTKTETLAPRTAGVHHVGLTVPDVETTCGFFERRLGFSRVGGRPDYPSIFVSDGQVMLTLWQAAEPASATPFDRKKNVGLHHLALRVPDGAALDTLHDELADDPEVQVEFRPEPLGSGGARHMMMLVPGGVRVELIALPQ